MTDHKRAAVLGLLLSASPALAAPVDGFISGSVGYRHSVDTSAGGLSLGVGLGGYVGRFGLEYESIWSNDHTLKIDGRVAGRNDNRFNLLLAPVRGERFRLTLGLGGSLGWIKPPGKPEAPGTRELSQGIQEYIRLDLMLGDNDFSGFYGLRLGASHRWQSSIAPAPDHSLEVSLVLGFGPSTR